MASIDLLDASIASLSAALLSREITALQLVKAYERRIEEVKDLHAVLNLLPDVHAQAEACDRALAGGRPLGPLHGIPILIKDHINIEGQPSCMGSHALKSSRARHDATLVRRLKEAGAIILGFANMSQWGFSRSKTQVGDFDRWSATLALGQLSGWSSVGGQGSSPYYPMGDRERPFSVIRFVLNGCQPSDRPAAAPSLRPPVYVQLQSAQKSGARSSTLLLM
jgi:amidase